MPNQYSYNNINPHNSYKFYTNNPTNRNIGSHEYNISDLPGQYKSDLRRPGHLGSGHYRSQPGSHPRETPRSITPQPRNMETPTTHTQIKPKKLFDKVETHRVVDSNRIKTGAEGMNVEFLLLNTLIINAVKVQTVIENFIKGKEYTSIFCFTEIKVESLNFNPVGIKIFSKHRNRREKKGGGTLIRV